MRRIILILLALFGLNKALEGPSSMEFWYEYFTYDWDELESELRQLTQTDEPPADGLDELDDLKRTLEQARQLALTYQKPVVVCASRDGLDCAPNLQWNEGWFYFVDEDQDVRVDANSQALGRHLGVRGDKTLSFNRETPGWLRFNAQGETWFLGTFTLCNTSSREARKLIISTQGMRTEAARC